MKRSQKAGNIIHKYIIWKSIFIKDRIRSRIDAFDVKGTILDTSQADIVVEEIIQSLGDPQLESISMANQLLRLSEKNGKIFIINVSQKQDLYLL